MDSLRWLPCFLFLLVLAQALLLITRRKGRTDKRPPGPAPIPIFGNLFQLGNNPHKSLSKLAKTHGPIMTLKLGQTTTVVFSSATLAKEILQKHDLAFCNRTIPDAVRALQHHEAGMPWMPVSTTWRNLRKICNLHIFASQKLDANQYLRHRKVQELLADVHDSFRMGEAIDIGQAAFKAALNLMSNTVFSIDLADSTSDTALEFRELVQCIKEELGKPNLGDYFPCLFGNLDLQGIRRGMTIHFGKLMDLFDRIIDKRLQLRTMNDYISTNDFLDNLLNFKEENSAELDRDLIKHLLLDLFTAGTETTASTLEWAMAELLHNPKALLEVQRELKQSIGERTLVEESDVACLPYLQAIVKETLRLHPPVPLLLPRKAGEDVEIHNFIVPKGAQVLVNAWAIGRDPTIWEEPDLFLPKRFLGSEVDIRGRDFGFIPFGAGRRICPGLPLAMRMVHLMLGGLIHSFDWKLEDGVTPERLDMEDKFGLVLYKAQPLRAIPISI
ncbi:geraniol 8-hydroxylase-like [Herrania umbratica]|uniref:Geraniol 8-hydroxylase-like n=1 Tax=Herrania umbratica TaxID=108875 RepID=A0A6J1AJX3_9ROSI|nr:geraniol 8-hydroxylase-like [Herrania umbratica]XP_021286884.1 geraniol 8-hydroxylase-like [Herrania umbratica]